MADAERMWWEQSWTEREDAMWTAFGPSHPSGAGEGYVTSFAFGDVPLPGACAYTFRPDAGHPVGTRERRDGWLYVTHGLAQWTTRSDMRAAREAGNRKSGSGYEFAMIFDGAQTWVAHLLQKLMTYAHMTCPISAGDRFPFEFMRLDPDDTLFGLGGPDPNDPPPADATRALVFWRYLSPYGTFTTSTGSFELRVATTITGPEWELAKETSSCHLLLLLNWAGIGQRSVPSRSSVTDRPGWQEVWSRLRTLPFDDAKAELRALYEPRTRPLPSTPSSLN